MCLCRSVGEAEIAAALAGPTAVLTTDALKRRCGVGFGDCQGNLCAVGAIERVARATGLAPNDVEKGPVGSWIVAGVDAGRRSPEAGVAAFAADADAIDGRDANVLIVGGGMAGIGAAIALVDAGVPVVVVERRERPGGAIGSLDRAWWTPDERAAVDRLAGLVADGRLRWVAGATVVALDPVDRGWRVDVAAARSAARMNASRIVLATGGYVMPREHSLIEGPRPSGVMTADLVADALDRGWLPARHAVVIGSGRLAGATAARLRDGGAEVVERSTNVGGDGRPSSTGAGASRAVRGIRGQPRLAGVEIDGEWIDADGLVLADRLQAATFLLRGLGLGDERPGIPAPVDAGGALPVAGLWATGTCVEPDVDHAGSLAAGTALGRALGRMIAAAPVPRRAGAPA